MRDADAATALLREIEYRTRNDLQSIASLAEIASRRTNDPFAQAGFAAIGRRVMAVAALYDHLRGGSAAQVELGSYLSALCCRIRTARDFEQKGIFLATAESACVRTGIDIAATLGIIVTELVSNAEAHAFPEGEGGRILVSLRAEAAGIVLAVADDGRGASNTTGFELELVRSLARYAGGEIERQSGIGTVWRIAFGVAAANCGFAIDDP
jgi:two-component sensor histidine kinase